MAVLKLIGFTPDQCEPFRQHLPNATWYVEGQEADHAEAEPDTVPIVRLSVAEHFIREDRSTSAVLWVPKEDADWDVDSELEFAFEATFYEDSPSDLKRLQGLVQCKRLLDWAARVEDIPPSWFDGLTETPRKCSVDDLPFSLEERAHLQKSDVCREEVYRLLQERAEQRWQWCPNIEEQTQWLKSSYSSPRLEEHLIVCALCRETLRRQALLLVGAEIIPEGHWRARWEKLWGVPKVTIPCGRLEATEPGPFVALWALFVARQRNMRLFWEGAEMPPIQGPSDDSMLEQNVRRRVQAGNPIQLEHEHLFLHLQTEGEDIVIRGGESEFEPFERFTLIFRQGPKILMELSSRKQEVRIPSVYLSRLQQADSMDILV